MCHWISWACYIYHFENKRTQHPFPSRHLHPTFLKRIKPNVNTSGLHVLFFITCVIFVYMKYASNRLISSDRLLLIKVVTVNLLFHEVWLRHKNNAKTQPIEKQIRETSKQCHYHLHLLLRVDFVLVSTLSVSWHY